MGHQPSCSPGMAPERALTWHTSWSGMALPRFVRLILRDRDTDRDLLGKADFAIRANAPPGCGQPDAGVAMSCRRAQRDQTPIRKA